MCEPMTIAATAAVAGTGLKMYANHQAGRYENRVAQNNAQLARWAAQDAVDRGSEDVQAIREAGAQAAGTALAQAGASGLEVTVGSPAAAIAQSKVNAERDVARARANAAREAWGYRNEAQDQIAKGKMAKRRALLENVGEGIGLGTKLFTAGKKGGIF